MPPSRQVGGQELDGLLGTESPSKEVDSSCWGKKKKKKKKSLQEDTVSNGLLNFQISKKFAMSKFIRHLHYCSKVCNATRFSTVTIYF